MRLPPPARLWMLAGLLAGAIAGPRGRAEPPEPIPGPDDETRTVNILEARDAGTLGVTARGRGEDKVKLTLRNTSPHRLKVVMPPGLVAAAATGQLQSMGLGAPDNVAGAFGAFDPGDTSVGTPRERGVAVPAGKAIDLVLPAVCLNFGLATPTVHDVFRLVDVDDYTADPAARQALRGLATLGTSHGVAQAVAWNAFNGLTFEELARQTVRPFNAPEIALAEGFLAHLDDGAAQANGRLTIRVVGEGPLAESARRLDRGVDGRKILGLTARSAPAPAAPIAPALHLGLSLSPSKVDGPAQARLTVRYAPAGGPWRDLGGAPTRLDAWGVEPDGPALAEAVDRAVAAAFVTARPARRTSGLTTLRIDNRLPFTLAHVVVLAGDEPIPFPALGIGPGRRGTASIQAAKGTIDRVELNGL